MNFNKLNIEIKAKIDNPDFIRKVLVARSAQFLGTDHQVDTYFKVRRGRLKIREGNIERYLIYYQRKNKKGPKRSEIILIPLDDHLKGIFYKSLDILCVVKKEREIYLIDNVKFHIDEVKGLGLFVEIEAMLIPTHNIIDAYRQIREYKKLFNLKEENLLGYSYSDIFIKQNKQETKPTSISVYPQLMLINSNT
jgi:predicted adenylyl cyclase CyaB